MMAAYNADPNLAKITHLNHELTEAYELADDLIGTLDSLVPDWESMFPTLAARCRANRQ